MAAPTVAGHRSNLKSHAFRRGTVSRVNIRGTYQKGKKGVGISCCVQISNHRGFGPPPTTLPWCKLMGKGCTESRAELKEVFFCCSKGLLRINRTDFNSLETVAVFRGILVHNGSVLVNSSEQNKLK